MTTLTLLPILLAGVCLTLAAAVQIRQLGWRVGRWRRGRGPCVRGSATNDLLRWVGVGLRLGVGGQLALHCPRCALKPAVGGNSP